MGVPVATAQDRVDFAENKGATECRGEGTRKELVPPWGCGLQGLRTPPEPQGGPVSIPVGLLRNGWAIVQKNARKSRASLLQQGWGLFLPARKLQVGFRRVAWGLECQEDHCYWWEDRVQTLLSLTVPLLSEGQVGLEPGASGCSLKYSLCAVSLGSSRDFLK